MSEETGQRTSILHLSGGGDLSSQISRRLAEGGLRAEEFADPYLAMGWLAGRRSVRATAAVVDCACLTDDVGEFPRLAMSLTSAAAVYLYGDRSSLESDPGISQSGARTVATSSQVQQMVTELERLVGRRPGAGPAIVPPAAAPVEKAPPAARPEPSGEPSTASADDHQAGEAVPSELRMVGPASQVPDPKADALTKAAAQRWPNPVLEVVESEEEPIATILPEAEEEEPPGEVPTPWSPSAKRPERTPPRAPTAEQEPEAGQAEPPARETAEPAQPTEPILTPEELEALLGRPDRA